MFHYPKLLKKQPIYLWQKKKNVNINLVLFNCFALAISLLDSNMVIKRPCELLTRFTHARWSVYRSEAFYSGRVIWRGLASVCLLQQSRFTISSLLSIPESLECTLAISTGIALSGQGLKLSQFIDKTDSISLPLHHSFLFLLSSKIYLRKKRLTIGTFPSGSVELWAGSQFKGIVYHKNVII